ncbi:MAG: sulfatase-like hydrolase/transferase [Deltaproteobacteria bacterium]|nr:sulfatase-like hydrolase/transferase [Deltaproteobacteria bacterium]
MPRLTLPALLAALSLGGCSQRPEPVSVLLVTLDTTRADHLGCYGYVLADTPTEDRLAAEGTRYARAYATSPLTIPSHSSVMTGRYPPSHGVRDNGDFILSDDAVTLAERFRDAGYDTAAVTSAFPTRARWGFGQGFRTYHDPLDRLPTQLDWKDQRTATEVVDDALGVLDQLRGPSFVWVHFFDAHWPYEPPEPYLSAHPRAPYDGEIAYASHELGRLVEAWDRRFPRSVIAVTGDHGEGLGDGGEQTHGFLLHDGTLHVPLILRGEGVAAGQVEHRPVSHVDIAPTLLHLAGLPLDDELQGHDLRQGGSERPYSEALTGQYNLGLAPLFAYTEEAGRYTEGGWGAWYQAEGDAVLTVPEGGRDTLAEAAQLAAIRATLDEVLAPSAALDGDAMELLQALGYVGGDSQAEAGEIDPRDVIDLIPLTWRARQAIGQRRFSEASQLIFRLEERMSGAYGVDSLKAQLLKAQNQSSAALEAYTDLYLRAPSSTLALQLAELEASHHNWLAAEGWYSAALEHQPESPEAMAGLVQAVREEGDLNLARELATEFLYKVPDHAEISVMQAELYLLDGRADLAWGEAAVALDRMPRHPRSWTVAAQAAWELGEADYAISLLEEALRMDLTNLSVRLRLAECYLEVGRNAEATRTLAPAARLFPDDPLIQERYAAARAALGVAAP